MTKPRLFTLFAFAAAIASCARQSARDAQPVGVTTSVERGPLELHAVAAPAELLVGDPLTLALTFTAPADYVVAFPPATEFGDWEVVRSDDAEPRPTADGGTMVWTHTYELERYESGAAHIPALSAKYAQKTGDAEPDFAMELTTDPLDVAIRGVLTTQDAPTQPRDISGVRAPPPAPWTARDVALLATLVVGALGLLALVVWLVARWRARPAPPILPEVWAHQALNRVSAQPRADGAARRAAYYDISEIVRQYIERKFGFAAPDMTTEEFLDAAARPGAALPFDAASLRPFLEQCDIVKYAALEPQTEDVDATLGAARNFVDRTATAATERVRTVAGAAS